ncbi:hypothetical protein [Methylorubrum thiocyanatum]|uniref:Uncharacterized protein n=1 Tax=Methylorubrum thiocyanatum TaxID=47958 RepID=A0AA40S0D6_9HYPH|nr:hypothetical protein [Methylorubrum thiocyanatum]MBA8912266.1 hypothetical protein [Methylorubrum thiocyanatum]
MTPPETIDIAFGNEEVESSILSRSTILLNDFAVVCGVLEGSQEPEPLAQTREPVHDMPGSPTVGERVAAGPAPMSL